MVFHPSSPQSLERGEVNDRGAILPIPLILVVIPGPFGVPASTGARLHP